MITDSIQSLRDNLKQRVANPFLGTFILVWVAVNWEVVYAFFFFDDNFNLVTKVAYFKNYWTTNVFVKNLTKVTFLTILVLVITYFFLSISRLILNYFENVVIPYIQKISKGKIYTEEQYNQLLQRILVLENKVDSERKAKNEALEEIDKLQKDRKFLENIAFDGGEISDEKPTNDKIVLGKIDAEIEKDAMSLSEKFDSKTCKEYIFSLDRKESFEKENVFIQFLLQHDYIIFNARTSPHSSYYIYDYTKDGQRLRKILLNMLS